MGQCSTDHGLGHTRSSSVALFSFFPISVKSTRLEREPGGILAIEAHRGKPDADPKQASKTGYVPEAWAIAQIEAAGFKLAAEGDFLHHPEDPRDVPVFKPAVPVDEFVLKYQKPM